MTYCRLLYISISVEYKKGNLLDIVILLMWCFRYIDQHERKKIQSFAVRLFAFRAGKEVHFDHLCGFPAGIDCALLVFKTRKTTGIYARRNRTGGLKS